MGDFDPIEAFNLTASFTKIVESPDGRYRVVDIGGRVRGHARLWRDAVRIAERTESDVSAEVSATMREP